MSWEDTLDDATPVQDRPRVEDKPAAETGTALRSNIAKVESALTEFEKVTAGLADLAERHPPDLVFDVSTTKGMAEAVAHRAAWRDPRINVEKLRRMAKAPVLALGKDIDARAAWLTEQLLVGETPVHEQIKAEEQRKEAEKQARINAEFGRVTAIQEAIGEIAMEAMTVAGKPAATILARLDSLRSTELDPAVFQEMMPQAKAAKDAAVAKLELMHKAQQFSEIEAAKVAAERAELAELRRAVAEQKAKDEAAAAAALKAEQDRAAALAKEAADKLAAERAEFEEERRVAREQQAEAVRVERERAAAEAQRLADIETAARAERDRQEAVERAERERVENEARAAREVEEARARAAQAAAEAATQRLHAGAAHLLACAKAALPFVSCDFDQGEAAANSLRDAITACETV